MCRVLAYLGRPIVLDDLFYKPDSSLVTQSYDPKLMTEIRQNLSGFGMAAWDRRSHYAIAPFVYRTHTLPFYDDNLKNLSSKIKAQCVLAHVRGIEYDDPSPVSNQNVHPFLFDNTNITFAHNGYLFSFEDIRYEIAAYMKHEYKVRIRGTTDTEWMYALFLSMLDSNKKRYTVKDIHDGILDTIAILKKIRKKNKINKSSTLNFFISTGDLIFAMRYTMSFGHYESLDPNPLAGYTSLWYTYGEEYGYFDGEYKMKGGKKKKSIIIASEPLTSDNTTWIEVPEYSFISASLHGEEVHMKTFNLAP
jgi:glutamine amidotransferase